MLTLTPSAQQAVSRYIGAAEEPVAGLRISVTGSGCFGLRYGMTLEAAARSDDLFVDFDDVRVFVDPVSAPLLAGVRVEFLDGIDGSGFKFHNPDAVAGCGCGKSFSA